MLRTVQPLQPELRSPGQMVVDLELWQRHEGRVLKGRAVRAGAAAAQQKAQEVQHPGASVLMPVAPQPDSEKLASTLTVLETAGREPCSYTPCQGNLGVPN